MTLTLDSLSREFFAVLSQDEKYPEILDLIKQNSAGNIWIIGGLVYKTIAGFLQGITPQIKDYDFVVEQSIPEIIVPKSWRVKPNSFGNLKFTNRKIGTKVDLVSLWRVYQIYERGLEPEISNFLSGVPFNIHSIAFNTTNLRIIGNIGIRALEERVVRVYDSEMARLYAQRYRTTVASLLHRKSEEIGFRVEL